MKHNKPTPEELKENIEKIQDELETPVETPEVPEIETPEEVAETPQAEEPETPEPSKEAPEEIETPEEPETPSEDYKKKYAESTREAQVLHSRNKKINETIEKANALPDPTDEEMSEIYKEWDVMDEVTRKLAKDSELNKRRFQMLDDVTKESKKIDEWNQKVDEYIGNPETLIKIPELDGREDEFKLFATKPTRRGIDFEDLVSAFLYEVDKNKKPKQKGNMFEQGNGGPKDEKKKTDKLSPDQAAILMRTNYKKYKEYLTAGKIDMGI